MTSIQRLLKYLNENIYPLMPKKEVKRIKSKYLGGELLHEIDLYKNDCVNVAIQKEREDTDIKNKSNNNLTYEDVYPKGRRGVID